jgi:hypothetical protein
MGCSKSGVERWPGRGAFLRRILPRTRSLDALDDAILIDGSVLANAPFRLHRLRLQNRPARRRCDRRFVYIDPTPGIRQRSTNGLGTVANAGASYRRSSARCRYIPASSRSGTIWRRSTRSARIRRLRHIVEAMRPQVEAAIERAFGTRCCSAARPKPPRAWRQRAQ